MSEKKGGAPRTPDHLLQQAVNAVAAHGDQRSAAKAVGMDYGAFRSRVQLARLRGFRPDPSGLDANALAGNERLQLQDRLRELESTLKAERRERLAEDRVLEEILGLANAPMTPPAWAVREPKRGGLTGIPSLMLSDLHWGEVVLPSQIHNKNSYSVSIAKQRLRRVIEKTIDICFHHMTNPDYPGIVVNLGGDLISGDIHEELSQTNELTSMQTIIDIVGALSWALDALVERFGNVWVVGVAGNHGRNTHKPRAKNRAFTNFDWLVCQLLRRHFAKDRRFSWLIPDGPDAWYRIYGHRYLLTHGDQFRGGDSLIGALGPVLRGDMKKRARNSNIDIGYDTMLLGHWHQYINLRRVIVNGSLKGYDEYAAQNNFPFEVPIQALWFTHAKYGRTTDWPIYCEDPKTTFTGGAVQLGEMA